MPAQQAFEGKTSTLREIPLTKGMVAVVDDEDYEWLSQFKWQAVEGRCGSFYAHRQVKIKSGGGTGRSVGREMQRDILDPDHTLPRKVKADHRNGDTLDNCRQNLRLSTDSGSNANRRVFKTNLCGFKGVETRIQNGKARFRARLKKDGKVVFGGTYQNPADAARAYNRLAKEFHGEFAHLNVIPGETE